MADRDLFGQEVAYHPAEGNRRVRNPSPKGYAARPGSGPAGETCKTCEHYCRVHYHNKVWLKCELIKWRWTHGAGTDIKARSPACEKWETVKLADLP